MRFSRAIMLSTLCASLGLVPPVAQMSLATAATTTTSAAESSDWQNVAKQIWLMKTITTGQMDPTFQKVEKKHIPWDNVTDARLWRGFCRQGGRTLFYNLKTWKYIASVSLDFKQDSTGGIFWPKSMTIETSQDGNHWSQYGDGPAVASVNGDVETLTVQAERPVMAAYMKISFPVQVWVYARNLQVWNSPESIPDPTTPPFVTGSNAPAPRGLLSPGQAGTIHHMLLVYTGANGNMGTWSVNDYKPMLAYYDQQGVAESRLFDTMLFLPYGQADSSAVGWTSYLNDLFKPGGELDNLNQAAQNVSKDLHENIVESVVLTIPFPANDVSSFGSITSGGPNLDFVASDPGVGDAQALLNREAAVQWYYQQLMSDWQSTGYSNLSLQAIYWNDEAMNPGTEDVTLAKYAHTLTAKDGYPLIWIPYYGASGVPQWNTMGFDAAILQPNYYEVSTATTKRMQDAITEAKQYGLGIELEVDSNALRGGDKAQRYLDELKRAALEIPSGSSVVTAMYDGSKALLQAYESTDPIVRSLYDATGQWMSQR